MSKGGLKYVPEDLLCELEEYKLLGLKKDSDCFKQLARDARIGREINQSLNKTMKLINWGRK